MKFGQFVALSTKNLSKSSIKNVFQVKALHCLKTPLFNCFSKTMKNVFNFIEKTVFVLQDIKIFVIFPFFFTLFRFKRKNGSGIIHDDMNWLAQICKSNFWNNSKLLYIT